MIYTYLISLNLYVHNLVERARAGQQIYVDVRERGYREKRGARESCISYMISLRRSMSLLSALMVDARSSIATRAREDRSRNRDVKFNVDCFTCLSAFRVRI